MRWYDSKEILRLGWTVTAIALVLVLVYFGMFWVSTVQLRANLATLETVCKANALGKEPTR